MRRFRQVMLRFTTRLSFWWVLAAGLAVADGAVAPSWGLSGLHVVVCLLAFQTLSRRDIPRLILGQMLLIAVPYLARPPYGLEPMRLWALLGLSAAAYFHLETQRRRKRRLVIRQQLQRRVRRRAVQVRRINEALRREIARRQATQQLLTRAETHLQSLAQRMQLQVLRKDIDGVITYANEAFCRGIGRPADEVIGSTDADLYPRHLADAYRQDDHRVIETGRPVDHIESHPTPDGKTGWVQVFKAPEYDEQNRIIGIQMIFWDVTETYRKTAELRRSEARKRALFDAAREAVLLVDRSGIVVEANPAAEQMLSVGREPLAGRRMESIAVPEASLQSITDETAAGPRDAGPRGAGPRDAGPRGADRRAEEDGERMKTVAAATSDAAHAAVPAEERRRLGDDRPPLTWDALPFGERREIALRPAEGELFPAEVSVHPIPLENSFGLAIFIRDVTLRHRALKALQEAKRAAEEASRIKSEFMASVSHEIRTPLGGITGSAELLCQMDLPPKALQYVEMIRHSGELLSSVIGDILDFASIEAGRLQITPEPTDLHRCIGEAFRSLAARAIGKNVELVLTIMPDVPRTILVDANRLRQVIINLAGNAIKFTPAGYVLLRVGVETGEVPGLPDAGSDAGDGDPARRRPMLRIEMIDSGIGIAKERLEKIFEPFEQGDSGTTRRYGGTGLGLSISDKLIRRMGGTIQVISRVGHGSTFRCFVPLTSVEAEPGKEPPAVPTAQPRGTAVALKIRHPVQRKAIGDLLLSAGYRLDPKAKLRIVDQSLAKPRKPGRLPRPDVRTIWLAGADEPSLPDQDPRQPVLLKPILPDDLLRLLRDPTAPTTAGRPPAMLAAKRLFATTAATSSDGAAAGGFAVENAAPLGSEALERPAAPNPFPPNPTMLLLVDDSPVNQAVIRDFLVAAGYQVELADCGQAAVDACERRRYDCVLMDLQMPGMDGIEARREIIQLYQKRGIEPPPFIALTAHATQEHRRRCLEEGMNAFLVKPIDRRALVETIGRWTSSAGPADAQPNEPHNDPPSEPQSDQSVSGSGDWHERMLRSAGGDPSTAEALIEAFLAEVPELCSQLRIALDDSDAKLAKRAAHTLKSCLKYIAPEADWSVPLQVENAAQREDWETVRRLVPDTLEVADRWTRQLESHSRQNQG